jgi:predicted dehydrogenase
VTVSASVFHKLGMREEVRGARKYKSVDYRDYNDVEDSAAAFIRFDNGMALAFEASWVQNIKEERQYVELSGTKGGASLSPELEVYETRHGYLADVTPRIEDDEQLAFDRQARHFYECVTLGTPCESPAEDGVHVMRIIDAIYESGRLGHEVFIG